ncbi:enamine deaminase RidA (YjgF/YER057c/UK114 family) [Microvirga flocculans]|uniref:Enamine deaminase RidA (YjgF/YER057c/UK114 family) n=1 Tax=Microvirga flocculans TaxID=217168 RepID=A0A7W6IGN2_9HYPH|nr:Rid family hydrolase [Microvirga flocculans]MBB4041166.1 enamine deaminase RidA (YjgF/YER057c/UK114 family) [Microvirga flocculans]
MKTDKIFEPVGILSDRLTFSPAVRVGNMVWLSGMTATDENRQIVGIGDIAAQTRYIFKKMETILQSLGAGLNNIVETVDYVTTFEGYERTAAVRREVFGGAPYPAATGVLVSGLVRPEALIEIRATAVLASGHAEIIAEAGR